MQKTLIDISRRNFIIGAHLAMTGFISGCASSQSNLTLQQPIADEKPWTGKPVFSIVDVQVNDGKAFGENVVGHSATVAEAGGKFLAAGGPIQVIEGTWSPKRVILHRWPDEKAFRNWYKSDEYRPWRELRHSVSSANVVLANGLSDAQKIQRKMP